MGLFDSAKDKATEAAGQHGDKVEGVSDQGLDKAGQLAEDRGVDADKIDQGKGALDDRVGDSGGGEGEQQA